LEFRNGNTSGILAHSILVQILAKKGVTNKVGQGSVGTLN